MQPPCSRRTNPRDHMLHMEPRPSGKQIQLTVFDNEPLARLAQQRLQQEDVPCIVRSLGVGPGGWGVATYLPHGLYVGASDEMKAREILELPPSEIAERDGTSSMTPTKIHPALIVLLLVVVAAVLLTNFRW